MENELMQLIRCGKYVGITGINLAKILRGKENKTLTFDESVDEELVEGLSTNRPYTYEEILELGMILSKEVREYVIKGELRLLEMLEEEQLNEMGFTRNYYTSPSRWFR